MPRDPDQTDPLYQQLISPEEVIHPSRRKPKRGKRYSSQSNDRSNDPSLNGGPKGPFRDYAPEFPDPSHGASFVNRLLEFLLSTRDPWRTAMGFAVLFLVLSTGAGRGWIVIPGLPPFANAASLTEVRVEQLDEQIEDAVKAHCLASTEDAKTYYYNKLKDLKEKYGRASPLRLDLPTCKELGVREVIVDEPGFAKQPHSTVPSRLDFQ